jgi:hypothetical protein
METSLLLALIWWMPKSKVLRVHIQPEPRCVAVFSSQSHWINI